EAPAAADTMILRRLSVRSRIECLPCRCSRRCRAMSGVRGGGSWVTQSLRANNLTKYDQPIKVSFAMSLLRLDSLEIFETVVRHGGFRAAAASRGVSSSAISQSISVLEQALGLRLLSRTTRSVAPTE